MIRVADQAGLEALVELARRWSEELERLRQLHEDLRDSQTSQSAKAAASARAREEQLRRALEGRDGDLRALRVAAAARELDLQKEHDAESRRQGEEIASLKKQLEEAESASGDARDEETREVKRHAYERERELRRSHAEKLSETEKEADRRVSALRAQRESDNRSLIDLHTAEKARREEELLDLRLRQNAEYRAYSGRIEELARERSEERTSLEEAVAKLREKHEAERARLREHIERLEEDLEEQESISVALLGELGYLHEKSPEPKLSEASGETGEIELAYRRSPGERVLQALRELNEPTSPTDLLREGIALFNETEHVKVIEAVSKSLGEPGIYAEPESHGYNAGTPVITFLWAGMGWRRYVAEPRGSGEPKVYLAGYGEGEDHPPLPDSGPNARLDARGLLSLGIRPL
jgi:chromosome segregation ATPase